MMPEHEDRPGHAIIKTVAPWEMRDVIAKDAFVQLQQFHGDREDCVKYAEEDADDAYEIANTFLRVRRDRKDKYMAQRRKGHAEDEES